MGFKSNNLGIWRIRIWIRNPFSIFFGLWSNQDWCLAICHMSQSFVAKQAVFKSISTSMLNLVFMLINLTLSEFCLLKDLLIIIYLCFYHSLGTNSVLELKHLWTLTRVVKGFGGLGPRINFTCQKENRRFCRPKVTQWVHNLIKNAKPTCTTYYSACLYWW